MANRYLIVILARGGSRGIRFKNICPLHGRPLIEYTSDSHSPQPAGLCQLLPGLKYVYCWAIL